MPKLHVSLTTVHAGKGLGCIDIVNCIIDHLLALVSVSFNDFRHGYTKTVFHNHDFAAGD